MEIEEIKGQSEEGKETEVSDLHRVQCEGGLRNYIYLY